MSKGTPKRNIRIPDDVWQRAHERAEAEGTTVSLIIQTAVRDYADGKSQPCSKT